MYSVAQTNNKVATMKYAFKAQQCPLCKKESRNPTARQDNEVTVRTYTCSSCLTQWESVTSDGRTRWLGAVIPGPDIEEPQTAEQKDFAKRRGVAAKNAAKNRRQITINPKQKRKGAI